MSAPDRWRIDAYGERTEMARSVPTTIAPTWMKERLPRTPRDPASVSYSPLSRETAGPRDHGKDDFSMDVISIGGASRSGSTLLSLLLGRVEGCLVVGELRYVWTRGYRDNMLCGCGTPFRDCDFWSAVLEEAYGGFSRVPIDEIQSLHSSVAEIRQFPALISPLRTSAFENKIQGYLSHLDRLCSGIEKVSGAKTLVDSSKLPSYCYLLSQLPASDARLVHLVRDSRAVAYSFMRKKRKPDIHWEEAYMRRFSPLRSVVDWNVLNVGMELLRRIEVPYHFLRYEDLVRDPRTGLMQLLPTLPDSAVAFLDAEEVAVARNHSVSGNPLRFEKGAIRIRLDSEWQYSMTPRDRRLVTSLTWPLLARYRYVSPTSAKPSLEPASF